jgi:hypothetical protein
MANLPNPPLLPDTVGTAQLILLACTAFKGHNINQTTAGAVAALKAADSGVAAAEQEPQNSTKKGQRTGKAAVVTTMLRTLHGTAPTSTAIIYRKSPSANIGLCNGKWCAAPSKKTDASRSELCAPSNSHQSVPCPTILYNWTRAA